MVKELVDVHSNQVEIDGFDKEELDKNLSSSVLDDILFTNTPFIVSLFRGFPGVLLFHTNNKNTLH